ncbi:MAG: T9SS type A sorting domain-containing protein [Chitinophagales bacterium]
MRRILLYSLVLLPAISNAQPITFQQALNFDSSATEADIIKPTNDGGYVLAGVTSLGGSSESFLSKYNSSGEIEWTRIFYDQQSHVSKIGINDTEIYCNQFLRFLVTTDDGFLFGGGIDSSVFITYPNGVTVGSDFTKMFAILTDGNGNLSWSKKFRASDNTFGEDAIQTSDGNFILAGSVNQTLSVLRDIILIKIDIPGNIIWSNSYGGSFDEGIAHLIEVSPVHLMLCGTTESFSNNQDIYALSLDSAGQLSWSKNYGSTGFDYGKGLVAANEQGYYFFGNAGAGNPSYIALIKTDSAGTIQWANTYGNFLFDGPQDIFKTIDNKLIILVNHYSSDYDGLACEVDDAGNSGSGFLYGKTGNSNNDFITSLLPRENGFLLAGTTNSFSGNQYFNQAYLLQTHDGLMSDCFYDSVSYSPSSVVLTENSAATLVTSMDAIDYEMFVTVLDSTLIADTLCFSIATNVTTLPKPNLTSVFPNPSDDHLTVNSLFPILQINCFNQLGEIIFSKEQHSENNISIQTTELPQGVYLLETITTEGNYYQQISIVH